MARDNYSDIEAGFKIFSKYEIPNDRCVQAEHDSLYAGPEDASSTISDEDQCELDALSWILDENIDRYYY